VTEQKQTRKQITKKIRFEVFKRDSFKCQYCGATAPEVILHVDHIKPVSKGGLNELTNLITSCAPCNLGKRDRKLDDKTAISKSRAQMEELQERREQLEMMMEWQESLRDLKQDVISRLCDYWNELAPGYVPNDNGKNNLKKWLRHFSIEEIMAAIAISAEAYIEYGDDGSVTSESWEKAFAKIPGICRVERVSKEDPDLKDLYYIRGIARNRCDNYFNNIEAIEMLKAARSWDVPLEELRQIACSIKNWSHFRKEIYEAIEHQQKIQQNDAK
jgi:hypothetical protein